MTDERMVLWVALTIALIGLAWNVAVLATCTYVVFWLGYSGWWYLLALVLCGGGTEAAANGVRR